MIAATSRSCTVRVAQKGLRRCGRQPILLPLCDRQLSCHIPAPRVHSPFWGAFPRDASRRVGTRPFSHESSPPRNHHPAGSNNNNNNKSRNDTSRVRQPRANGRTKKRTPSAMSASFERTARETTNKILTLGEAVQNNGATKEEATLLHVQKTVGRPSFWSESSQALEWWTRQGTAESVDKSFALLDALADHLSSIAQQPQLSSQTLNSKVLQHMVQNWFVAWVRNTDGDKTLMTPPTILKKLESYRTRSQNSSPQRRNLRPTLENYHVLMDAASLRSSTHVPAGFNESLVRHLLEQQDDPSLQPDMKTMAHILHGWSTCGQVVSVEELESVLTLLREQLDADRRKATSDDIQGTERSPDPTIATTVDLFNEALFAMARDNSNSKDSRDAEKMLSILNFMERMARTNNEMGVCPNAETYALVLNAFARTGKGAQAEMVLRNMVDRYMEAYNHQNAPTEGEATAKPEEGSFPSTVIGSAKPTAKSFTIVITAFARSEEKYGPEKAEGILEWQQELNTANGGPLQGSLSPDTISYNNVLRAWSWRRSDKAVERCEKLRKEMYQQGITPDLQTYGQSFKAIALSNLSEKGRAAVQAWREMEMRGIKADDYAQRYFEKCVAYSAQKPASSPGRERQNRIPQRPLSPFARAVSR